VTENTDRTLANEMKRKSLPDIVGMTASKVVLRRGMMILTTNIRHALPILIPKPEIGPKPNA
jgi:hypothetical protein